MGFSSLFLTGKSPEEWDTDDEYIHLKKQVKNLRVVNDTAERGIKLIQDYNLSITKNEEQKQYLLQVVADHRKKFPQAKMSLLTAGPSKA